MAVTSEKTFVVSVPESQAEMLSKIWSEFQSYYDCFYFVWELKKQYDLAQANSAHLVDSIDNQDILFVQHVDAILQRMGDNSNYPGSNVVKALTKRSEPDRFYNEYKDLSYTERGALNEVINHCSGRK
tara:strand:+ start:578 stop:961 length:384 start_codon:yes stop_codon:yes gene_type:complete